MGEDIMAKAKKSAENAEAMEGTMEGAALDAARGSEAAPPPKKRGRPKKSEQPEAAAQPEVPAQPAPAGQEGASDAAAPAEPAPAGDAAPKEGFTLQYDVTSQERYVDSTSQKTEFDRMLDELARISKEMISWELEKFTKKFQGDGDEDAARAKKFEAFLGGFITNAAMELYDRGYPDVAFQRLDQARNVLAAKQKLEDEMASIKARNEENSMDLGDMLGLFGDEES